MKKILHLQCISCGRELKQRESEYLCTDCQGNLEVQYDYKLIRKRLSYEDLEKNKNFNMWRYIDILPVDDNRELPPVFVGWTPLYEVEDLAHDLGIANLFVKDEGRNPTGSIKDRGSAIVTARALELETKVITDASTGNTGDSLACLTANLPLRTIVFVPKGISQAKITQLLVFGAKVIEVDGNYEQAYDLSMKATKQFGWYNRNDGFNPYAREGTKTCAFEICEQLNWETPDKIIVPTGDGTILSGLWKGFTDFNKLGIIDKMPQMIAIQAQGSCALKNAFDNNGEVKPVVSNTVADSIAVDYPRDTELALQAIEESGGNILAVSEEDIIKSIPELAQKTNVFAEPAGACGYFGLKQAIAKGIIKKDESAVLIATSSGLKNVNIAMKSVDHPTTIKSFEELQKIVDSGDGE